MNEFYNLLTNMWMNYKHYNVGNFTHYFMWIYMLTNSKEKWKLYLDDTKKKLMQTTIETTKFFRRILS